MEVLKENNTLARKEIQKLYQEINDVKKAKIEADDKWRSRFDKWGEEIESLRKKNKELRNKLDENSPSCENKVSDSINILTKNFKKLQHFLEMECPKSLDIDPSEHQEEIHTLREEVKFLRSKNDKDLMERDAEIELLKAKLDLRESNRLSEVKERMKESIIQINEENQKEVKQLINRNNILKEKLLNQVHQQESIIYLKKKLLEKDKLVKVKNKTVEDLMSQVKLRELEIEQLREAIMNFQKALEMKSIVEMRNASMRKYDMENE